MLQAFHLTSYGVLFGFRITKSNVKMKFLLDDVQYWRMNSSYSLDEVGPRIHHRLVSIQRFPNGNRRHSRLHCDAYMIIQKAVAFAWGENSADVSVVSQANLDALRAEDNGNFTVLLAIISA